MGRILGGTFVALVLAFCVTSTAHAAKIPPTAQCVGSFQKLFSAYLDAPVERDKAKQDEIERNFAEDVAATGCVTDAEPIYVKMPAKPFTEQCVDAAPKADAYFKRTSAMFKSFAKTSGAKILKPYERRSKILKKRIDRLEAQDRLHEAAVINRELQRLKRAFQRRIRKFTLKMQPRLISSANGTFLVLYELSSLRCLPFDFDLESKVAGPVGSVVKRNEGIIFGSIFFAALTDVGKDSSDSDSSNSKGIGKSNSAERSAAVGRLPFGLAQ